MDVKKTAVYTNVNGYIVSDASKTAKIKKRYYPAPHHQMSMCC